MVKQEVNISSIFPAHLFWDVRMGKLDVQRDKNFIIPRALYASDNFTFYVDIQKLENIYTPQEIADALKNITELISNEVCRLITERYHIEHFQRFSHANREQKLSTRLKNRH